jgi:hypothetical protein
MSAAGLRRIGFPLLLLNLITFASATELQAGRQDTTEVVGEFPIDGHGDCPILIPATKDKRTGFWLLDTGAALSVLDRSVFPDLHRIGNQNFVTNAGAWSADLCDPPDVRIGPCILSRCGPVSSADLSNISATVGQRLIGILGVSAIKAFVVQFDFEAGVVRFLKPVSGPVPEWGKTLSLGWKIGIPSVRLTLGTHEADFFLDSGQIGDDISVPRDDFDGLARSTGSATVTMQAAVFGGAAQLRSMRLRNFSFAGFKYDSLVVGETKAVSGNVGLEFLSRHITTVDFPNDRLYLKPGKTWDRSVEKDMSGLHILRTGSQTVAKVVDPGTPAYLAGMRDDDVLLTVNGAAADKYALIAIRRLLRSGDGVEIKITYQRSEKANTADFMLRRRL